MIDDEITPELQAVIDEAARQIRSAKLDEYLSEFECITSDLPSFVN